MFRISYNVIILIISNYSMSYVVLLNVVSSFMKLLLKKLNFLFIIFLNKNY